MNEGRRVPEYRIGWDTDWDADIGLWRSRGGHTRPVAHLETVHAGPNAANRLLLAAQTDQLHAIDTLGILQRLRRMQTLDDGPLHGCLRWYWEEDGPVDTNAAFFTGLSLIVVWKVYRERLTQEQQDVLLPLLRDLYRWFRTAAAEREWFYPNKFLGDVTCVWLLHEICGAEDGTAQDAVSTELSSVMLDAAAYWRRHGWGWGEHLSDIYSTVCLDELSVLLLLGKALPDTVRDAYKQLFDDLLGIEDAFAGGPRVPALRSYDFVSCPKHTHYRETVEPLSSDIKIGQYANRAILGHTLYHLHWQQLAPPALPLKRDIVIACFDNQRACARLEDNIRMGSVSRFPLMPSIEHFTHGLAWQSMPVVLARPGETWAFLQWETQEAGRVRAHPAEDVKVGYLGNALSEAMHPPLIGWTWALQYGDALVALRVMPALSTSWDRLTDRVRIVGDPGETVVCPGRDAWHQVLLRWPGREVSLHCLPLGTDAEPVLERHADKEGRNVADWGLTCSHAALEGKRLTVTLWAASLAGEINAPPKLTTARIDPAVPRARETAAWDVDWQWPGRHWRLRLDPLSSRPLREIARA